MNNTTDNSRGGKQYPFRIDVAEAEQLIGKHMPAYGCATVKLAAATGRILRQSICAERDQPPFDRATMDGIALRSAALHNGLRSFIVKGVQPAGSAALELTDDEHCVEIMTGAPLPSSADTVVPIERITIQNGRANLESGYTAKPGQFVHRRASDHAQHDCLLQPGVRIGGPEMAILTAAGQPVVQVAEWPAIAIVSTGDELTDVGESIEDFQIRSSNDRAIESCLRMRGCETTARSRLPDEPKALRKQIARLHEHNDILILSGGVSMGKYDYIPAIMEELGIRVVFHKIQQRPGLPMWFGVSGSNKPVFALPGNPVSTIVCCVRYVLPAIEAAMGLARSPIERLQLAESVEFEPDLTWFLPVSLSWTDNGIARALPKPTNTSGDFIGLRHTAGFVELGRGRNHFPAGFAANLYRW